MKDDTTRILYLCADTGIPYWGTKGGSIHIREFVGHAHKQGYNISVVARTDNKSNHHVIGWPLYNLPDIPADFLIKESIDTGGEKSLFEDLKRFHHNAYIERFLADLFSRNGYNLIYERYSLFGFSGLKFALENNIPFVLEVNAPLVLEADRYRSLSLIKLAESIEKFLFTKADAIISVSKQIKEYITNIAPKANVYVVPNGVAVERYENLDTDRTMPQALSVIGDAGLKIGFVGRLRPWHGVENLIDAFAEFSQADSDGRLVIVGDDGGMKTGLQEKCRRHDIEDKVIFTGAVEHDSIPHILKYIDILTAPYPELSDFYFSALKVFEYMAAGKAIVASSIGQLAEILENEKTALLVSPGDVGELAEALIRLKKDEGLRIQLGKNARQEAFSRHTWNQRIKTISGIFDSVKRNEKR